MSAYVLERNGTHVQVTLGDKLTAVEVPAIQTALKNEIDTGANEFTFNLTATLALDSCGIGLLIAAKNSLARVNGALRVSNVSPDIFKLLQSMRLVDRMMVTSAETKA